MRIPKVKKIFIFSSFIILSVLGFIFLVGFWQTSKIPAKERAQLVKLEKEEGNLDLKIRALLRTAKGIKLEPITKLPIINTSSLRSFLEPALRPEIEKEAEILAQEVKIYTEKFLKQVQSNYFLSEAEYLAKLSELNQKLPLPETRNLSEIKKYYQRVTKELLQIQPPPDYLDMHKILVWYTALSYYIINEIESDNQNEIRKMLLVKIAERLFNL